MLCNLFRILLCSFILIYSTKAQQAHQQQRPPHHVPDGGAAAEEALNYIRGQFVQTVNPVSSPSQIINSNNNNDKKKRRRETTAKPPSPSQSQPTYSYSTFETKNKNISGNTARGKPSNNVNLLKGILEWDKSQQTKQH